MQLPHHHRPGHCAGFSASGGNDVLALEAEANAADDSLKLVFQADGLSEADSLEKSGYPPDALRVIFVSPIDLAL